jgi:hypothetical protein
LAIALLGIVAQTASELEAVCQVGSVGPNPNQLGSAQLYACPYRGRGGGGLGLQAFDGVQYLAPALYWYALNGVQDLVWRNFRK